MGLLVLFDGFDLKSLLVDLERRCFSGFQNFGSDLLMETSNKHLCLDVLAVVFYAFFLAGDVPVVASGVVLISLDSDFLDFGGGNFFEFL